MLGTFYEPQYALGREIFTKLYKMTSVMDDTYDAYGLFEELEVYTEAVQGLVKSATYSCYLFISYHLVYFT